MKNIAKLILLFTAGAIFLIGCKSQPASGIRDIYAGVADVYILREDYTLWGAGYNRSGQFGSGVPGGEPGITLINDDAGEPFSDIMSVAAGENHAVILKTDGTLWGAGDSSFGELGLGGGRLGVFTRLKAGAAAIEGVKTIAAGNNSTFYIDKDGSLWASGYNYYGELGIGSRDQQSSFRKVDSAGQNIKTIAAGIRHTVVLKEDGTLWAAGYNFNGQLGLGDTLDRNAFSQVRSAGNDVAAVAAGSYHTVILKKDGSVWTAGSNYWGQLGFTGMKDELSFIRLSDENGSPLTGIKEIAARGNITVLLKEDGTLLIAGNYTDTEGSGETDPEAAAAIMQSAIQTVRSNFAVLVPEDGGQKMADVKKIVLGYNSVYVIDADGRFWAAGSNRYNQLNLGLDTVTVSSLKLIE
ncbi:MAG: hypothetical protein FWH35_05825 [Treponema sp.]|nr:hypothetical protein [Treponema sp.]